MEKLMEIASYICTRYQKDFGKRIDEMKLHKILYFMQRESLVQLDEPMFAEKFQAWKYGPVLVSIRQMYHDDKLHASLSRLSVSKYKSVFDKVFQQYASKDSWSLSCLTHGEYSWQKARIGIPEGENSCNEIELEDIRKDAKRIQKRRLLLRSLQMTQNTPALK